MSAGIVSDLQRGSAREQADKDLPSSRGVADKHYRFPIRRKRRGLFQSREVRQPQKSYRRPVRRFQFRPVPPGSSHSENAHQGCNQPNGGRPLCGTRAGGFDRAGIRIGGESFEMERQVAS